MKELKYNNLQKNGLVWAKSLTWEKAAEQSLSLINKVCKQNNNYV